MLLYCGVAYGMLQLCLSSVWVFHWWEMRRKARVRVKSFMAKGDLPFPPDLPKTSREELLAMSLAIAPVCGAALSAISPANAAAVGKNSDDGAPNSGCSSAIGNARTPDLKSPFLPFTIDGAGRRALTPLAPADGARTSPVHPGVSTAAGAVANPSGIRVHRAALQARARGVAPQRPTEGDVEAADADADVDAAFGDDDDERKEPLALVDRYHAEASGGEYPPSRLSAAGTASSMRLDLVPEHSAARDARPVGTPGRVPGITSLPPLAPPPAPSGSEAPSFSISVESCDPLVAVPAPAGDRRVSPSTSAGCVVPQLQLAMGILPPGGEPSAHGGSGTDAGGSTPSPPFVSPRIRPPAGAGEITPQFFVYPAVRPRSCSRSGG